MNGQPLTGNRHRVVQHEVERTGVLEFSAEAELFCTPEAIRRGTDKKLDRHTDDRTAIVIRFYS
jgi:hypothetical protein